MATIRIGAAIMAICAGAISAGLAACSSSEPAAGAEPQGISNACIRPTDIVRQDIISDQEIRFEMRNGDVWANNLPRKCPSLKFQGGFTWDVRGMLVCSNEQTIYVRDDGTPCQLGAFTKLPKAE